jgi:hypothetical protein
MESNEVCYEDAAGLTNTRGLLDGRLAYTRWDFRREIRR